LRAAGMAVATLYPLGFYLLIRAYEMGDGRYPHPVLGIALACLGVLVSLGVAVRAQAATTRREYLGELIPGLGGFALMAIGIGTPVGLVAGIVVLACVAVLAACLPLLPDRAGPATLLTIAAAAGAPPGLAFGALVVALAATFEAGDFMGFIGIAGAAVWILLVLAAARAVGLPAGRGHPAIETSPRTAMALAAVLLIAGAALPVVVTLFAVPAQADVMPRAAGLGGGLVSVATIQTDLPALTLFAPLLLLGAIAYGITGGFGVQRAARTQPVAEQKGTTRSAPARPPVFAIPALEAPKRWLDALRRAAVPDQYRSIVNVSALEKAAAGGKPVLWLATLVALAYAVNR
ncbi:MAG: hypothetical protein QOG08_346, partial [Chloroflexota bacterium]|nr:hypothetical protein [Chloroflexota bacterium]